jgi:3-hydroxybutyryl-CoA dehydratase
MKNNLKAASLKYKDISVGDRFSFKRFVSKKDVKGFARLTGDFNPLHMDENFAKKTQFKGTIMHGMLAASLFSPLIGMRCPGRYALLLSQEIRYLKPIRPNSTLRVSGEVVNKIDSIKVVVVKTSLYGRGKNILVEGQATVKVMR